MRPADLPPLFSLVCLNPAVYFLDSHEPLYFIMMNSLETPSVNAENVGIHPEPEVSEHLQWMRRAMDMVIPIP